MVRDLYKRVLHVGPDYPTGMEHVRSVWKKALRNRQNCPSCYDSKNKVDLNSPECQEELLFAVNRGRRMVKEMIGVIQLKKYRAMRQRYGSGVDTQVQVAMQKLENSHTNSTKN